MEDSDFGQARGNKSTTQYIRYSEGTFALQRTSAILIDAIIIAISC